MAKIQSLSAYPILDSRGQTTVEVNLSLDDGSSSVASVPSGTSTGKYEAKTVGTDVAIYEIKEKISRKLTNIDIPSQETLDLILKDNEYGANSRLAVSIAFAKAKNTLPLSQRKCLPKLMMLIFEGGKHAHNDLLIQEYLLIVDTINEGAQIYQEIGKRLETEGLGSDVGLEGGFAPRKMKDIEALIKLKNIIGNKANLGLDVAASQDLGNMKWDYDKIFNDFPVTSLEDPFPEDNETDWLNLMQKYGKEKMIIGDDLTATNPERTKMAIEKKLCNGIIIKPNQIGTVSETLNVVAMAKKMGLKIVVSHRSGETNDTFIADLAVSVDADFVKFGAPVRGERVAKYNRLLEIEKRWK